MLVPPTRNIFFLLLSAGREVDAVDNTGDDDDGGAVAEADVSSGVS